MNRRFVVAAIALALAACASKPPAGQTPEDTTSKSPARYRADTGDSPVGVIPQAIVHDAARNRDVQFSVEYPTKGSPHPLIIFSHDFGGSSLGYVPLSSWWTSQGYVVIKPTHADAAVAGTPSGSVATQTAAEWRDRVRDITFVIDSLGAIEQQYPELQGKIDHAKIGVGGHGYGAFTAMLVGGARTFPGAVSYADARVKAVLAMSPPGPSPARGLTTESWRDVKVPVMYMTGTADKGTTNSETPEWRQQVFDLSPAGDKWLVVIPGVSSNSFTGLAQPILDDTRDRDTSMLDPNRDPFDPRSQMQPQGAPRPSMTHGAAGFPTIRSLSLAFWDAYLAGDAAGRKELDEATTRGYAQIKTK